MAAGNTQGGAGTVLGRPRPSVGAGQGCAGGVTGEGWFAERWWEPGLVAVPSADGPEAGPVPDWAEFGQEAVAGAPEEGEVPGGDFPGLTGFERVLAPLTACAGDRLERAVPERVRPLVDLPAVRADLERHLSRRLARMAARTLVLELHEARGAGRLEGADTRARFRDFLRRTGSRRGLAGLLAGRPVLARILGRAALDAAAAAAEMLERLADDHRLLKAELLWEPDGDPGPLAGIEPGAGDGHGGGRSVMLLRFANGARLVYKPRPQAVHRHFNTLVGWFNRLPGSVGLRTLELVDRGRYGWVEFVAARPCASEAEVEEFYRRQGALLALLHLLDGTDLHHENLIAVGGDPVLVDVETLFHPPLPGAATDDPAAVALHDSVYRVGLLPQLLVGDESALDMSAVGGGREAVSPVVRADWADAGTDRMRLVRRPGTFGESANRPRLEDGQPVEPGAHVEALCAGFRAGYTAISGARAELLRPGGLLRAFADDEVRVVARPTWVYSTLLDESTHPALLKDAAERQRVLESLRTDLFGPAGFPGLEDEEIAQLWAGDVPLFTARPGHPYLWGAAGRLPETRVDRAGLTRVTRKLAALDTVDRQDQEWIVRAAMATSSREPAHRPRGARRSRTADCAPEPERLLSAARSVGDQLVSQAYRGARRTNWIGLELLDDRYWRIGPMAADLAGGYTGPALFLAQLAALTGAEHYAEAARTALTTVPALLDALHERPGDLGAVGSGAFTGLGGIAYALAEVARLLGDPVVGEWVAPALRLAGAAARAEPDHGVCSGTAGGLVALLAAHRAAGGGPEPLRAARACADRLLAADLPAGPGFAAGAAGVGWALLRYAEAGGGERYRAGGLAALRAAVATAGGGGTGTDGAPGTGTASGTDAASGAGTAAGADVASRTGTASGVVGPGRRDEGMAARMGAAAGRGAPARGPGPAAGHATPTGGAGTPPRPGAAQTGRAAGDAAPDGGTGRHRDAGSGPEAPADARAAARDGAWCRGRAGIALAVLDGHGALDDPYLAAWAREAVDALGHGGPAPDDSLCHGEAGLLEVLGHSVLPEARPHWVRRAGALLGAIEDTGPRCGTPEGVPHPGLLTGLAGIGHGLLRAGFPDRIPPALLLRTPGAGL